MRSNRQRMSCKVMLSAWPIWREPVTFGGGITIVKDPAPLRSGWPARKAPDSSQAAVIRPSTALGSNVLSIIATVPAETSAQTSRAKCERWQTSGQKASFLENEPGTMLLNRARQSFGRRFSQNLLVTAHEPLDLGADEALHHGRQIGVKPSFEHRAQHFAGKLDDRIA